MEPYKIMLVDDEPWALIGLSEIVDYSQFQFEVVATCDCGAAALAAAEKFRPDAVISDIRMPDMTGIDLIRQLRAAYPGIQCAVISAYSDFEMAREAIRVEAVNYILKPTEESEVVATLNLFLRNLQELAEKEEKEENTGREDVPEEYLIDPENPEFPQETTRWYNIWLALRDRPEWDDILQKGAKSLPVRIGSYAGMLTEEAPAAMCDGFGVSMPLQAAQSLIQSGVQTGGRTSAPSGVQAGESEQKQEVVRLLISSAIASLEGGFTYIDYTSFGKDPYFIAKIEYYLYRHLEEEFHLRDLANEFYISETYLSEVFRKAVGETIVGFLRRIRLHRAVRLMRDPAYALTDIAQAVGYTDYAYFGRHFKATYGSSPDAYRKWLLEK